MIRIGHGFDVHKLVTGRKLILGGELIPFHKGLKGHSDADVLVHAVMDAVLGALALGDIGQWFPDTEAKYKDADSLTLLKQILTDQQVQKWKLVNLDCTVIAQQPKLASYIPAIIGNLADSFNTIPANISVKATTTEKLGFCGREEGIAANAVILLETTD